MRLRIFFFLLLLSMARIGLAEELPVDPGDLPTTQMTDGPHPIIAGDSHWAAEVVVAILGLFVAAMVIGPIIRAEAPEAVPAAVSHEEDPGVENSKKRNANDETMTNVPIRIGCFEKLHCDTGFQPVTGSSE